jgi:hypothetical protein
MRPRSRGFLFRMLPKNAVWAEVGVWKGDFSAEVLAHARPAALHLIDPWVFHSEPEYAKALYGARSAGQGELDELYEGVRARFSTEINNGLVHLHRMKSVDAAAEFVPATFDVVYIDADHTYEAVKQDLETYRPLCKPGAILAGDDYGATGWWEDGVRRAVDEFAASGAAELLSVRHHQFLLRVH